MLYFDEATHTYRVDDKDLKCVSEIVASQFQPFNGSAIAASIEKGKARDPDSRYFGMDRTAILRQWRETGNDARERGTRLHRDIESFYVHGKHPETPSPEWDQFLAFDQDHNDWRILGCEVRVNNANVAGTIDAVFQTPDGIVLVDWKRCKAIDYSGYRQGVDLMRYAEDCNYNKYSLQLSLYRELIGREVVGMFIVQIHPDLERYQKIRAQSFHVEAKMLVTF